MPNWCYGIVKVEGTKKNIENFCKLFIFEEDTDKDIKRQYFARSFAEMKWKDFKKEHLKTKNAVFSINFAWSATSCIIEGYPDGKQCITLKEACKKHKVKVTIDTEEQGMGFEEHIECDEKGNLIEESQDMPEYKCKCGNKQLMPTTYDIREEECIECGKIGKWKKCQ